MHSEHIHVASAILVAGASHNKGMAECHCHFSGGLRTKRPSQDMSRKSALARRTRPNPWFLTVMSPTTRVSAATVPATWPVPYVTMKGPQLEVRCKTDAAGVEVVAELCAAPSGLFSLAYCASERTRFSRPSSGMQSSPTQVYFEHSSML